jgi:ABC transport system ATP-binding/permease protein
MSEKILKALMQLFAIIARPESNTTDRRSVVESFLRRQLNQELVEEYLKVFDKFYEESQEKQSEVGKRVKRISSTSTRVLALCSVMFEELSEKQRVVVVYQLLEFVKSDTNPCTTISEQEMAFITTVADVFRIANDEFKNLCDFVLGMFEQIPMSPNVAIIDNNKNFSFDGTKHICSEYLSGQIRILHVATSNVYLLRYIGDSEMYINGQLIQIDRVYVFGTGSSVRNPQIKPIYYSDIVSIFNEDKHRIRTVFEAQNVQFKFKGGKIGLHNISFTEESGHLVGIMGASGAGKSTLLNVLNGSNPPSDGDVLINGISIHKQKEKIEGLIGHVSQDDLLIEELTVFQNLYYNAKLCFDNYSNDQLVEAVNNTLQNLGLYEIRDILVGNPLNKKISGGQRKRLNIALELIREPAVLFLDEPTSGLSSRDSENIMDLLKELSLKGKLVFVVIHQPSSDIFKMFDKLIILDTGGYLIYDGDPIESIIYFKSRIHQANWNESECHLCGNVNPEQVFNIVESNVLDEYGKLTHTRKISPREWSAFYEEIAKENHKEYNPPKELPAISFKIPNKLKQFLVFVKRDVLSKLANTQYLVINFFEAPLLAFLLSFIIKYRNVNVTNLYGYTLNGNSNLPVYLFMSVIVAIFIGLTVSAEEIIKDRKILKREAFLNLSWGSYLFSKVAVLVVLSAVQALTFVLIGNTIMEIKGMYFHYWLILFSAWVSANIMGLVISDSFKTVVTIYILIPFLVIPQIILSGIIVKFEKLNPSISSPSSIPSYGEIITARWAYEALAVHQFMENKYEVKFYTYDKTKSVAEYKKNYWVRNLKNKIDDLERNLPDVNKRQLCEQDLLVLRNEIEKENIQNEHIKFKYVANIKYGKFSPEIIEAARDYFDKLNNYYIKLYNKTNDLKDKVVSNLQSNDAAKEQFLALKRSESNEALTDFMINKNETDRVVEYKGRLYQKIDPIFMDPEPGFIKSHFYAPRKMVFGQYFPTFWVNFGVIWVMSIILFLTLYFRLLKKLLDSMEQIGERFSKKEE